MSGCRWSLGAECGAERGRVAASWRGRADGFRTRLSARTVRRHEDARCRSRARWSPSRALLLMDEPFAALDEITRFRLNNDLLALWQALRQDRGVRHPFGVRDRSTSRSRIVVMTARPGRVFTEIEGRRALSARRDASAPPPEYAGLLPARPRRRWREALGRGGRMSSGRARRPAARRSRRARRCACCRRCWCLRRRAALGTASCGSGRFRPTCCPGPRLVFETLVADWACCSISLLVTLRRHCRASCWRLVGGVGLAVLFNQSRLVEYSLLSLCGDPAGDADRGDRAAASHLCRSRRRCWPAPGSWRSSRSLPTPRSG